MLYFNTNSGAFGFSWQSARALYPNMSISVGTQQFGDVVGYQEITPPEYDPFTERLEETTPVNGESGWVQQWAIVPLDEIVIAANRELQKIQLKQEIAERRYQKEISGIEVNGVTVDTTRESQSLITGAAVSAMLDSTYTCRWKTPTGFIELDAAATIALAQSVRVHVQACFDRERELLEQLEAGTYNSAVAF